MSAGSPLCRRRYCGLPMEPETDGSGRVVFVCPGCSRNRQGLCRDCSGRVSHWNQLRCKPCARKRNLANVQERSAAWYQEHKTEVNAHRRERYHNAPGIKDRVAERGKITRAKTRHDDLWRFVHRKRMAKWRQTPKGHRSTLRSQRKYVAKRRQERAA